VDSVKLKLLKLPISETQTIDTETTMTIKYFKEVLQKYKEERTKGVHADGGAGEEPESTIEGAVPAADDESHADAGRDASE